MQSNIENKKEDFVDVCKLLQIKKMYAFGSVVTSRFNENIDINIFISFSKNLSIEEYTNN